MHDLFIFPPEIESREEHMQTRKIDELEREPLCLPHSHEEHQSEKNTDPSRKDR